MRPLGGRLSDRIHPVPVLTVSYGLVAVCALTAAGGLGGFSPPLVRGVADSVAHDYTWGFVLLAVTATGAGTLAATAVRRRTRAAAGA